jgi:tetratricopeptide (TPR) repeat protein
MTLDPGTSLGFYEVLGPLGAGGMGEVYRARDRKLGRDVAIKVLPEAFAQDPARLTRFDREARMLASVNHPALAAIYGLEEAGAVRYIVMELVPGETLAGILARGPMPVRDSLMVARQIAEGLEAAHEKGIVHRDLKPSNIKVTPQGRVKVLDLGLAKAMDTKAEDSRDSSESPTLQLDQTRPGVIVGTIEFLSPEQARGKSVDKRTDVWSFGCVLFEMLSGHRTFSGETPSDAIANILTREPRWEALPADTPPRVRELLERCLQKDPSRRLRDIGDARIVLEDAVAESQEHPAPPLPRAGRLERRLVLATLAALAVAAGLWLALRQRVADSLGTANPRSLAVLPSRDLSEDPGGQLIIDGLAETVRARLANVPGVQVVTPSLPITPSDREGDPLRLAIGQGASLALSLSRQRQGNTVRLTYSLWNTQTHTQVAGGDETGPASEIFLIQDKLTARVARDLGAGAVSRRTLPPAGLTTTDEQERYLQALGYLQRYDNPASVDAAIGLLTGLAVEAPDAPLVQAALARAYLYQYTLTREKDWARKAIAAADRATRLDAGIAEVHLTRGLILTRTGKGGEAIGEFQVGLSQAPNSVEGLLGLADAFQSVGRNNEAEATLRRAIALLPTYWAVYNQLGALFYALGRYSDAAEMFRKVVELTPDSVRGWNNLGAACQQADRFQEALEAYTRSAGVRANDGAYSNLGTLQFYLGHYREAVQAFEQAVRLTPSKPLYWANLGDAYRWAPAMRPKAPAAYARAISLAREQLQMNPRDADALSTLGLCLAKTGKPAEGLIQIQKALENAPGNPDYFYNAAVASLLLGRSDDAIGWLRQAVNAGLGVRQIEAEPEFEDLRKLDRYKQLFSVPKKTAERKVRKEAEIMASLQPQHRNVWGFVSCLLVLALAGCARKGSPSPPGTSACDALKGHVKVVCIDQNGAADPDTIKVKQNVEIVMWVAPEGMDLNIAFTADNPFAPDTVPCKGRFCGLLMPPTGVVKGYPYTATVKSLGSTKTSDPQLEVVH